MQILCFKIHPVWFCKQCQLKFYNSCSTSTEEFCSPKCSTIFHRLKKLLGKRNTLNQCQNLSWSLLSNPPSNLSAGNPGIAKLPLALDLIQTCFQPYIDLEIGIDKVSHAVYSGYASIDKVSHAVNSGYASIERLDYTGFYTVILEHKEMVVSAATVRMHGEYCAKMPFVCTHPKIEKMGMCRKLVGAIEDLLGGLGVRFLVLPAMAEPMWVSSFGFQAINSEMTQELLARKVLMCDGSKMLQKDLSNHQCDPLELRTLVLGTQSVVFPCQGYAEEDTLESFFGTTMKVCPFRSAQTPSTQSLTRRLIRKTRFTCSDISISCKGRLWFCGRIYGMKHWIKRIDASRRCTVYRCQHVAFLFLFFRSDNEEPCVEHLGQALRIQ